MNDRGKRKNRPEGSVTDKAISNIKLNDKISEEEVTKKGKHYWGKSTYTAIIHRDGGGKFCKKATASNISK